MPKKLNEHNLADGKRYGGMMRGLNAGVAVFPGLKTGIKSRVLFVIFAVVAYRLLDIGMDLGVESAVAFGSRPQP
jgi:hypothetical protein